MEYVDPELLEKIAALAGELPANKRQQMLDLIASWREDVRQAPRAPYKDLLSFTSRNGQQYGHARDVSASGVFIETKADFSLGDEVSLVLTFISAPNPMRLKGTVVRKTEEGIGISFDAISQSQVREMDQIISRHALIMRQ